MKPLVWLAARGLVRTAIPLAQTLVMYAVIATKKALGWEHEEPFFVPADALEHFRTAVKRGGDAQSEWQRRFDAWARANPDLAEDDVWQRFVVSPLPGWCRG